MAISDASIRRRMLRPLVRRRVTPAHASQLDRALLELEERAAASTLLPELVDARKKMESGSVAGKRTDPAVAKSAIKFAATLYMARRLSLQEYIFFVDIYVEGVHEARLIGKKYPELDRLSEKMRSVEASYGLHPGDYWHRLDAPEEWKKLGTQWEVAEKRRRTQTIAELEGKKAHSILVHDSSEFDRLRERGRRAFFHRDALIPALTDTVTRYEIEARNASKAGAYTAAIAMLAAALEGLLLLRCFRSQRKSSLVAAALPKKKRPRDTRSPQSWGLDTLIQVCLNAGWLPLVSTPTFSVRPDGLAHILRQARNYIHPGRVCAERPWVEADRRDFEDAEVIYSALFASVFAGKKSSRYRSPKTD